MGECGTVEIGGTDAGRIHSVVGRKEVAVRSLGPLVKTRAVGMTPSSRKPDHCAGRPDRTGDTL
jgi:hypothetical protein